MDPCRKLARSQVISRSYTKLFGRFHRDDSSIWRLPGVHSSASHSLWTFTCPIRNSKKWPQCISMDGKKGSRLVNTIWDQDLREMQSSSPWTWRHFWLPQSRRMRKRYWRHLTRSKNRRKAQVSKMAPSRNRLLQKEVLTSDVRPPNQQEASQRKQMSTQIKRSRKLIVLWKAKKRMHLLTCSSAKTVEAERLQI